MAGKLTHDDLINAIALNSKLTALEVEEALEVLSVIIQSTLQSGGSVDILGVGKISASKKGKITFSAGESLRETVEDPSVKVKIERSPGMTPSELWAPGVKPYKHKVNVCRQM
ncbi:HU family DNA-binding protein [Pseudomonas monteilii]|uniref:HU family DNA-binding protein n=1 Tax=Pseudomonas monteilii TaxID=76759 RepID=UPI0036E94C1D